MGKKVISIIVDFDDMSGRIYPGYQGVIKTHGHDSLHSGAVRVEGRTKQDLIKEIQRHI